MVLVCEVCVYVAKCVVDVIILEECSYFKSLSFWTSEGGDVTLALLNTLKQEPIHSPVFPVIMPMHFCLNYMIAMTPILTSKYLELIMPWLVNTSQPRMGLPMPAKMDILSYEGKL